MNLNNFEDATPDLILGGTIAIYKKAIDNPNQYIESHESADDWRPSTVGVNNKNETGLLKKDLLARNTSDARLSNTETEKLRKNISKYIVSYSRKFNCPYVSMDEGFGIVRYEPGQHYEMHADFGPPNQRVMSAVIYLNDDFDGGDLEFPFHSVAVKPEAGMLVLFPSNYAYSHIAHKVDSGVKYSIVTWLK